MELLQSLRELSNPVLDFFFEAVTILGEQLVLAGLVCFIYWCVDRDTGRVLLICLCLCVCLNGIVKDLVRAPRPFWQPGGVNALRMETATGYSFPSGHTQAAATLCAALALRIRQTPARIALVFAPLLIGFSRLYLGVHYLQDVVAGLLLGGAAALGVHLALKRLGEGPAPALLAAAALGALAVAHSSDTFAAAGLALGAAPGLLLERRSDCLPPQGMAQGLFRLLGGGLLLGALYLLPRLLLGRSPLISLVSSACVAFVAAGGWPWLYTRLERRRMQ